MRRLAILLLLLGCEEPAAPLDASSDVDAAVDIDASIHVDVASLCPVPLADGLNVDALESHLLALEEIASEHGDRAAGGPGYAASVDYVEARLRELGLEPQRQAFEHSVVAVTTPVKLELLLPVGGEEWVPPAVQVSFRSGSGTASGRPVPIGHDRVGCGACRTDEWADFPEGGIAWARADVRHLGEIGFYAALYGAAALIIEVPAEAPERVWTPRGPLAADLPIMLIGRSAAEAMVEADGVRIAVDVDTNHRVVSENLIVEVRGYERGPILMLGGHLDSVVGAPGINDNGTGVATLLELAAGFVDCEIRRPIRVAFWGAEEWGLLGSKHWVDTGGIGDTGVRAYLNLDMIGSTNGGVYVVGERGSGAPGARLGAHLDAQGVAWRWDDALDARSDHHWFQEAGVAVAGVFSGAEVEVDHDAALAFGSDPGVPHDPCYHGPCDGLSNVDRDRMLQAARGIAALAEELAEEP